MHCCEKWQIIQLKGMGKFINDGWYNETNKL